MRKIYLSDMNTRPVCILINLLVTGNDMIGMDLSDMKTSAIRVRLQFLLRNQHGVIYMFIMILYFMFHLVFSIDTMTANKFSLL